MASVWDEAEVSKAGDGIIAENEGLAENISSESSRRVIRDGGLAEILSRSGPSCEGP